MLRLLYNAIAFYMLPVPLLGLFFRILLVHRGFWEKLKGEFFGVIGMIYQLMRLQYVSYQGISSIRGLIYPRGKDTIFNAFKHTSGCVFDVHTAFESRVKFNAGFKLT